MTNVYLKACITGVIFISFMSLNKRGDFDVDHTLTPAAIISAAAYTRSRQVMAL